MTRQFKLAVVRASNDGSRLPDDVVFDHVWQGPRSLLRFWSDMTDGWFDFVDSAFFPWVDITVNPAQVDRWTNAGNAVAAIRAANPGQDPFGGFDGMLVLLHPGKGDVEQRDASGNPILDGNGQPVIAKDAPFDGGSGGLTALGGLAFSLVPTVPSDHTFACHELGHTLGADHPFGLVNSGVDYNGTGVLTTEYGSPYDVMSSASFGSRSAVSGVAQSVNPTFAGQEVVGWPGSARMGPAMSRANVHRWFPDALAGAVEEAPFPAPGQSATFTLAAAGAGAGTRLLILHPTDEASNGVGRVYVEYRPAVGWDAGLGGVGSGPTRAGVVVHTLEDIPAKQPHIWFRGSIGDDDTDTDLTLTTRPLTLTLTQLGPGDQHFVEVTVTTQSVLAATMTVGHVDSIVGGTVTGHRSTPCGDQIELGDWLTSTTATCAVTTTGLEPVITDPDVEVEWRIGGRDAAGNGGTGLVVTTTAGAAQSLDYSVDPATHTLTVTTPGGAAFSVDVVATALARDAAGNETGRVAATGVVTAAGGFTGMTPAGVRAIGTCWGRRAKEVGVDVNIDVGSLFDHHEVIQWQEDATRLEAVVATASGRVADEFRAKLGIDLGRFTLPDRGLPDRTVFRPH